MDLVKAFAALQPALQAVSQHLFLVQSRAIVVDIDDTLIFDDGRSTSNAQVKAFVLALKQNKYKVHLVTARHKDMIRTTKVELQKAGISYDTLDHAPESARADAVTISLWKFQQRKKYGPIALSLGDQWTDLCTIQSEDELSTLDARYGTRLTPWVLVKPNDGVTALGLKLADS